MQATQGQALRDLLWLLQSPSLLAPNTAHLLPDAWRINTYERNQALWQALAQNDSALVAHTEGHRRLGHYAESLVHFLAQNDPAISLLAFNQQVQKAGVTVGEIDFIWRMDEVCTHIELATKFYLLLPDARNLYHAVGANCRDSLGCKWAQMCDHQLRLHTHTPDYAVDKAYAWICGWLFTHAQHNNTLAAINPFAPRGTWGTWDDWLGYAATDEVWYSPPRLYWLSPAWLASRPADWQSEYPLWQAQARATLLVKLHAGNAGWHEVERWMVVADDWQAQAQALWGTL